MPLGTYNNNDHSHKKSAEDNLLLAAAKEAIVEFLGEQAEQANPLFLKNRTLTISCSTSAVAQTVREHQIAIVDKINAKLGKKEVDRIRYLL